MKYRNKYQAQGSVGASFGRNNAPPPPPGKPRLMDHVIDVGEFALNQVLTPFETITGTNFYDPKFESDFMQNTSDISSAIIGAGTDIAGTMVAGPLYHAGKFGLTKGSQALGLKDNTHSDHNAWAEKTASTIGFVGDAAGVLAGGVAEHGGKIKKHQTTGSVLGGYNLGYNNLGMNMFNSNAGSLQFPELSSNMMNFQPSNFNVTPSNFGDPGTWGQNTIPIELGGGTYSTTSDYWRPFTTEKGNLYRGLEGGQHLTNKDITLLTPKSNVTQFDPNLNSFVDAAGNPTEYSASFTPNNYTMFNRFSDKFIKPFANQTVVGAQQYGDAMGGNFKTLFGQGQGNLTTRIGNLDAKSLGQTVGLASAAAGIYNTWKPGARTQSQLVGDAEAALEASNQQKLLDEGWMGGGNTGFFRAAERGGNIGECKECNKMRKHMMKYYKGGSVKPQKMEMGTNPDIMSYLSNLKVGDKFSNLLNTATDKFGELKSYFNPSDTMPYGLKNVTYRGNKFTRNQNMDEFARLGKDTVVGQDRTYDDSARQNNAGIGYDKEGILSNLGPNHSKYKMMQQHLMAERGGNIPKAQYGTSSFMSAQPRFSTQYNLLGENKGLTTLGFGADLRNCWGGTCRDIGGGQFLPGFFGNFTPYKGMVQSNFYNPTTGERDSEMVEKLNMKGNIGARGRLNLDLYSLGSPSGVFAEGFGGINMDSDFNKFYGGKAGLQFKSTRPQKLPTFGNYRAKSHADFMPQWQLDLYGKYASDKGKSLGADFRYGVLGGGIEHNLDTKQTNIMGGLRWNLEKGGGVNNPGFKALPGYVQTKILNNMEMGGNVDPNSSGDVEIEVEGGETIQTIDGQNKEFFGPSHDQGGIITKANDGDFVYPKGTWSKRHIKRTERQAAILAKLEEAGINTEGLV